MRRTCALFLALALLAPAMASDSVKYSLEDSRPIGDAAPHPLKKILVVAISDDRQIRNRFEDKFVSHLRGRGIAAMASHPLVPSLMSIDDRDKILAAIAKEGVDSVVTIRAVGLDTTEEKNWAAAWSTWAANNPTVRELIQKTLPVPPKKSKRYGIEFALWETQSERLVWTSRTGTVARKHLQAGVEDLLLLVIEELKDARWI